MQLPVWINLCNHCSSIAIRSFAIELLSATYALCCLDMPLRCDSVTVEFELSVEPFDLLIFHYFWWWIQNSSMWFLKFYTKNPGTGRDRFFKEWVFRWELRAERSCEVSSLFCDNMEGSGWLSPGTVTHQKKLWASAVTYSYLDSVLVKSRWFAGISFRDLWSLILQSRREGEVLISSI